MFVRLGEYFPGKRADDLFSRADAENDGTISCDEFIEIYMTELEEAQRKRVKMAENIVRFKRSRGKGLCSCITRLLRSDSS